MPDTSDRWKRRQQSHSWRERGVTSAGLARLARLVGNFRQDILDGAAAMEQRMDLLLAEADMQNLSPTIIPLILCTVPIFVK
eukprot:CAMPEP_0115757136 /NCGR_PEP_ID=MMETSP0272-20121206/98278_1 /TAXON_ID=71861 /ORGANISM="Scrippsiella trochoidea, Strain CCMP3099" /LENGTH=81 /DNA_ID=CAMNT_0003202661 /DNA_START=214 /DNA_END=456 /DNA_ORIENTATION=-